MLRLWIVGDEKLRKDILLAMKSMQKKLKIFKNYFNAIQKKRKVLTKNEFDYC